MSRRHAVRTATVVLALVAMVATPLATAASARAPFPARTRVGSVTLHPCAVYPHALCGHIRRAWDPDHPGKGHLSVGFAFVPASDRLDPALGTVVPHEGGPGYSTTDSAIDYAGMYGLLLKRYNMLLVDQRGTGRSAVIDCPALQNLHGPYDVAARTCGRTLGNHADLYGSALSADDLSAVINDLGLGKVDLYGDSYGTFFTQVFAGRHPAQINSIILDSAYPPTGETAWYPTQTPAMRHSITLACRRSPACAKAKGTPLGLLRRVLKQVRAAPYRGRGYDADGYRHHVVVTGASLVGLAFGATYGPAYYRELAASLRSALAGDRRPLLRLIAETNYGSANDGAAKAYSEGLDAAVTCQDYPQLFNMSAPPAKRQQQYIASVHKEQRKHPEVYAPFTVKEYLHSDWEEADWCLKWPSPSADHQAGPPAPSTGHYSTAPTLVLSGELDSITTPAEGSLVTAEFPNAEHVIVANSFHVTAEDDTDGCGSSIVRRFVSDPARQLDGSDPRCTTRVPPLRAIGKYQPSYQATAAAHAAPGNQVDKSGRRAAAAAALTVADEIDRWLNNYSGHQVGLYGGRVTFAGNHNVTMHLHGVKLVRDLAVSGVVHWHRYSSQLNCELTLNDGAQGRFNGRWNTRAFDAKAALLGHIDGHRLIAAMRAP